MADFGSIPGRVKPKTIKIGMYSFPAFDVQQLIGQCEASTLCGRQVSRLQLDLKIIRFFAVSWPRQLGE